MEIKNVKLDQNDINIIMESLIECSYSDIADSALADLFVVLSKCNSKINLVIEEESQNNMSVVIKRMTDSIDKALDDDRFDDVFDDELDDELDDGLDEALDDRFDDVFDEVYDEFDDELDDDWYRCDDVDENEPDECWSVNDGWHT